METESYTNLNRAIEDFTRLNVLSYSNSSMQKRKKLVPCFGSGFTFGTFSFNSRVIAGYQHW